MKRQTNCEAGALRWRKDSTKKLGNAPGVETGWPSTRTEGQPLFSFMAEVPVDVTGSKARPKFEPPRLHVWRFLSVPAVRNAFCGCGSRWDAFIIDCAIRSEIANAGGYHVRA